MKTETTETWTYIGLAATLGIAAMSTGCGGSADDNPGGDEADDSVIGVFTRVTNPDSRNFYLHLLRDWPEDGKLDYSKAIEFGEAFASFRDGDVYISDREALSITKYSVGSDLTLEKRGTVSLQGLGVSFVGIGWLRDQPYVIDSESGQVVRFDPETMTILEGTDIREDFLVREGIGASVWGWNGVVRGDRGYFGWSFVDGESGAYRPVTALGAFPLGGPANFDELIEDERCPYSDGFPFEDDAGHLYIVGQGSWSPETADSDPACVLRLSPGQRAFDKDFALDLLQALDARDVYTTWPLDRGRKLLVNYYPRSVPAPASTDEYWSASVFQMGIVDLSTGEAAPVSAIPPGGSASYFNLELDGSRYVQVYSVAGDTSEASLRRVDPDGSAEIVVRAGVNGDFQSLARLR